MKGSKYVLGLCVLASSAELSGCASPNIYGSARTLGRGKVQHAIALEGIGAVNAKDRGMLPSLPTYQVRVGVAQRVDVALRITNLSGLAAMTIIELRRGRVDLALAPSLQGSWMPRSAGRSWWISGQAPLVAGIHLSPRWTLLPTAGIGFGRALGPSGTNPPTAHATRESPLATASGLYLRAGLAVQLFITPRFALQPEVTMLGDPLHQRVTFFSGLGFVFGHVPRT